MSDFLFCKMELKALSKALVGRMYSWLPALNSQLFLIILLTSAQNYPSRLYLPLSSFYCIVLRSIGNFITSRYSGTPINTGSTGVKNGQLHFYLFSSSSISKHFIVKGSSSQIDSKDWLFKTLPQSWPFSLAILGELLILDSSSSDSCSTVDGFFSIFPPALLALLSSSCNCTEQQQGRRIDKQLASQSDAQSRYFCLLGRRGLFLLLDIRQYYLNDWVAIYQQHLFYSLRRLEVMGIPLGICFSSLLRLPSFIMIKKSCLAISSNAIATFSAVLDDVSNRKSRLYNFIIFSASSYFTYLFSTKSKCVPINTSIVFDGAY